MSELAPMGDDLSVRSDVDALRSRPLRSAEVRNAAMAAGLAFAAAGGAFALGAPGAAAAHAVLASALPLAALGGLEADGSSRGREQRGLAPSPVTWRASLLLTATAVLVVVASGAGERSGVPLLWLASLCVTAFILWPLRTGTSRPLLITLAVVGLGGVPAGLCWLGAGTALSPVPPWGARDIGMLLFFGALSVTFGLLAHLQYWRLERRLAALRRTMP
jgi:hypothetical protein